MKPIDVDEERKKHIKLFKKCKSIQKHTKAYENGS
jgi:hypothetical protein